MKQTPAHPRTDHPQARRGRQAPGRGQATRRGLPAPRDRRVDLAPLAGPIRRHEGRRRQAAEGARDGERPAEEARRRSRARQGDAQGAGRGKLLTPNRRRRAVRHAAASGSGSPNAGPVAWSANTAPPSASRHRPERRRGGLRAWLRDFSQGPSPLGLAPGRHAPAETGWRVNNKRIQRLWREEGLKVPYRKRKKPLRGIGVGGGRHVPDPTQRDLGDGLPVRQTDDGKHAEAVQRHRRVHPGVPGHRWPIAPSTPTASSHCSIVSPPNAAPRPICASTTVPSSSPTPLPTGAGSTAPASFHRPRLTMAERLDRVVQRPTARRVPQRPALRLLLEAQVLIEDWRIDYNMNRPHSAHGELTPTSSGSVDGLGVTGRR